MRETWTNLTKRPRLTIYNNLEKFNNNPQTIEYRLWKKNKQDDNMSRKWNSRREQNLNLPWNLTLHDPLAKLTPVLDNEIKCAIPQFIFYTPAVVKTYKELYVSQVLGMEGNTGQNCY